MNTPERQSIIVEGVIAHHKARIPNPVGRLEIDGSGDPKVTLQIKPSNGLSDARVARHVYTVNGNPARTIFNRLLMHDLLHTGTPVVITYNPDQSIPKGGDGWVMDSISVPSENEKAQIIIDLRSETNGHHE